MVNWLVGATVQITGQFRGIIKILELPRVTGGFVREEGALVSGQWHHLTVSYPGNGADLNQTRIYWDGSLVDLPASSVDAVVNTASVNDLRIGSYLDGTNQMSGSIDEFRISTKARGPAWAAYEYQNQKTGFSLLTYDLEYQSVPVLPTDLNLTIVQGVPFYFQIKSTPCIFLLDKFRFFTLRRNS